MNPLRPFRRRPPVQARMRGNCTKTAAAAAWQHMATHAAHAHRRQQPPAAAANTRKHTRSLCLSAQVQALKALNKCSCNCVAARGQGCHIRRRPHETPGAHSSAYAIP